ncbi:NAD-dependent epimerase/dehydratase family protein [Nibrella saemangeumensis]|uniref:NAD-dependent epimerase/dehydratase family protein n=1 Tax=Nibrella saemangeumensis TaxID=1084526 RepID=A0ABP8MZM6_9BACT
MSILLTGASGYVGRRIHRLLAATQPVTALGRQPIGNDHIRCDLAMGVPQLEPRRFRYVVHAAGKAHSVPRTAEERAEYERVNVQGTQNLLTALEQTTLPDAFVHISTVLVYGRSAGDHLDEQTPLTATDAYGLSKIRAEQIVLDWGARTGVRTAILRLPLVVADHPQGNLAALMQAIRRGYYVRIGNGEARRSMVLADDVAAIIPRAAKAGGVFNLTDGYHPSVRELEDAIARQYSRRYLPTMPPGVARTAAAVGDRINALVGRKFPFDSITLAKLTGSLTFSDEQARRHLNWQPKPVLTFFV